MIYGAIIMALLVGYLVGYVAGHRRGQADAQVPTATSAPLRAEVPWETIRQEPGRLKK